MVAPLRRRRHRAEAKDCCQDCTTFAKSICPSNYPLARRMSKTEIEKMRSSELYDYSDPEIMESFARAKRLCAQLNQMSSVEEGYRSLIEMLIPGFPETSEICPPFVCDHGHGIKVGEHTFINYGCVILDGALVSFGNHVKVGPYCQFYTPQHPRDYMDRRAPQETAFPIIIEDDAWLGGGVVVCPGVRIGKRSIVAAGSVVVHDIPDDCMAAGNPAIVKKRLI